MTLLYYDPLFLDHQTGRHPERPKRLIKIWEHLEARGWSKLTRPTWKSASLEAIERVHDASYPTQVREFCAAGGGQIESDTVCSPQSYEAALRAAGAVCDAVGRVLQGEDKNAFCIARPPGHHALRDAPMGFCLFNSIAIGAREAIARYQLDRVLVIDWDVHHGNGTQDAFWDDGQVGFLSMHRFPFYPGSGAANETGVGKGLGATRNLPVTMGTKRQEILKRLSDELDGFAEKIKPQLVMLSAGFDAHREDPVGSLGLETEDFAELTEAVLQVAKAHCGGKLVSLLEGGYNVDVLPHCVETHLKTLNGGPLKDGPPSGDETDETP